MSTLDKYQKKKNNGTLNKNFKYLLIFRDVFHCGMTSCGKPTLFKDNQKVI